MLSRYHDWTCFASLWPVRICSWSCRSLSLGPGRRLFVSCPRTEKPLLSRKARMFVGQHQQARSDDHCQGGFRPPQTPDATLIPAPGLIRPSSPPMAGHSIQNDPPEHLSAHRQEPRSPLRRRRAEKFAVPRSMLSVGSASEHGCLARPSGESPDWNPVMRRWESLDAVPSLRILI